MDKKTVHSKQTYDSDLQVVSWSTEESFLLLLDGLLGRHILFLLSENGI